MRILYIDIDTLRPDHLGCYGYHEISEELMPDFKKTENFCNRSDIRSQISAPRS